MTGVYSPIGDGGNHLEVRYQPIVDLTTGSIAHLEALVRLKTHAGIVGPEDFIDSLARDERRWRVTAVSSALLRLATGSSKEGVSARISGVATVAASCGSSWSRLAIVAVITSSTKAGLPNHGCSGWVLCISLSILLGGSCGLLKREGKPCKLEV